MLQHQPQERARRGSGLATTTQFTAASLGPALYDGQARRRHFRQAHPLFDDSVATAGGGKATRRRRSSSLSTGSSDHHNGGGGGGSASDSSLSHSNPTGYSEEGVAAHDKERRVHSQTSDDITDGGEVTCSDDDDIYLRRRNVNVLHIFDQVNSWHNSWTMTFVDPTMELEYLKFFYQPKRVIMLGYCVILVLVAIGVQILYAFVTLPVATRALCAVVTVMWMVAGVFTYLLKRDAAVLQQIVEEEEMGVRTLDEVRQGQHALDDDVVVVDHHEHHEQPDAACERVIPPHQHRGAAASAALNATIKGAARGSNTKQQDQQSSQQQQQQQHNTNMKVKRGANQQAAGASSSDSTNRRRWWNSDEGGGNHNAATVECQVCDDDVQSTLSSYARES